MARVAVENKLSVSEAQRRLWLLVVTTNTQWGECSHTDRHPVLVTVIDINADHFVKSRNTQAKVSFSIMVFFILDEIREQNFFHFIFTSFLIYLKICLDSSTVTMSTQILDGNDLIIHNIGQAWKIPHLFRVS